MDFQKITANLINQCLPGEIKHAYNDILTIVGPNAKQELLYSVEQYNIDNFVPIKVQDTPVIISKYNKQGSKYIDYQNSLIFSVDPIELVGLDIEPYQEKEDINVSELASLYESLKMHVSKKFAPEVTTIAVHPVADKRFALIVSCTKYNPSNFWNGNWKSCYIYDTDSKLMEGEAAVNVHYFEDGNVKFNSSKTLDQVQTSDDYIKVIESFELEFENEMQSSFNNLNELGFKSLRRRLPVTRSKINWGRAIGNYRLGKDAASTGL
ncbi:related to F-actin-capping protein subunit alpha [Saccharomycodes ludwigii]|uniref:F-actin-capping protein subunit alpha n=1 Tax=Saccharomycodes ludwigii TaxID=36035 RepID=A0A376B9W0_9ASCO|nr:related to F-actin-capping protein subunit alpha [Saccharomycodes ludwigii]